MLVEGAQKLKRYLKERGLSQEGFAAQAGVFGPQINQFCRGARRPSIATALKIEAASGGYVLVRDWVAPRKRRAA